MAKREAISRISQGPGFPLNFMPLLLSRSNEEKAVTIMVALLRSERETKDTQASILKALGRLGKKTKVPASPLIEKLREEDPVICREAIAALALIKSKEGLSALLKLLDEERNKYAVIWALGEIGDPTAIPILSRLLANGDDYEKYNARKALEKIEERREKGRRSSIAMAGGSDVRGVPPRSSQERERVQVDRASDGHVSREILARAPGKAISKRQDVKSKKQQARQIQIRRAGEKEKRSQQPLAEQRKQLLRALSVKRTPQKPGRIQLKLLHWHLKKPRSLKKLRRWFCLCTEDRKKTQKR
ncbi:MAG: HEAT repeat domain-containing protein [Deltaproteobacteria bacterium]|nr:HEAT repeat domain-containing protein [Deltaproteobacteria bacterium]